MRTLTPEGSNEEMLLNERGEQEKSLLEGGMKGKEEGNRLLKKVANKEPFPSVFTLVNPMNQDASQKIIYGTSYFDIGLQITSFLFFQCRKPDFWWASKNLLSATPPGELFVRSAARFLPGRLIFPQAACLDAPLSPKSCWAHFGAELHEKSTKMHRKRKNPLHGLCAHFSPRWGVLRPIPRYKRKKRGSTKLSASLGGIG
jgi:hypothetical protein